MPCDYHINRLVLHLGGLGEDLAGRLLGGRLEAPRVRQDHYGLHTLFLELLGIVVYGLGDVQELERRHRVRHHYVWSLFRSNPYEAHLDPVTLHDLIRWKHVLARVGVHDVGRDVRVVGTRELRVGGVYRLAVGVLLEL